MRNNPLVWMVCLLCAVVGCSSSTDPSRLSSELRIIASAHPTGTLLRDARGGYWMVSVWPDRESVTLDALRARHISPEEAIQMSASEERCLRDSGRVWHSDEEGLDLVRIFRSGVEEYWYLDRERHYRWHATAYVVHARRDDLTPPPLFTGTVEELEAQYALAGESLPPDGLLFRADDERLYFYAQNQAQPFTNDDLALAAGYRLSSAVSLPLHEIASHVHVGVPLTREVFLTCPLADFNAETDEDLDMDGSPRGEDCDDEDPRRAPSLDEICDGIDNNCDGFIDNDCY